MKSKILTANGKCLNRRFNTSPQFHSMNANMRFSKMPFQPNGARPIWGWLIIWTLLASLGCEFVPITDKHPDDPFVEELIANGTFRPVEKDGFLIISLQRDGSILEKHGGLDSIKYRLRRLDDQVLFESTLPMHASFLIDSVGNIYLDQQRFSPPKFALGKPFETVFLQDSLQIFFNGLLSKEDTLAELKRDAYRTKLVKSYGLDSCAALENDELRCSIIELTSNRLLTIGYPDWNKFDLEFSAIPKFDETSGFSGGGGRLSYHNAIAYFELPNGLRFKTRNREDYYQYAKSANGIWLRLYEGWFILPENP